MDYILNEERLARDDDAGPNDVKSAAMTTIANQELSHHNSRPSNNISSTPRNTSGFCGYGVFQPKCLQALMTPKMLIATLCCFSFIHGYVTNGLNNANMTTYEKRFFLKSSEVGAIASSNDFAAGLLAIPISYFGAHMHKPRFLGVMALVFGFGSFIMLLPHVISDNYNYGQETTDICSIEGDQNHCAQIEDKSLPNYLYVLCAGMVCNGLATAALYSVGTATIDECVTREAASFALSLLYAAGSLGPALGFILGGQFLKIYVDTDVVYSKSIDIDERDPSWVGAWWIGFIISLIIGSLVALALFAFPRDIPVSDEVLKSRIDQSQAGLAEEVAKPGFGKNIHDLPRATLNLLKNMPFMFTTLAGISDGFIVMASAAFTPKFIEQQFNKTASDANLIFGAIVVVGGVGGQLVGGYVCKRAKLKVRGMLRWSASCAILTAVFTSLFWLHCDEAPIAGVNRAYGNRSIKLSTKNLENACNAPCGCSERVHIPVCGEDNLEYLTPCYAGCKDERIIDNEKIYYNCSCVQLTHGGSGSDSANAGRCDNGSCTEFYVAMVLLFFLIFTLLLDWAPRTTITLRCVPESQRTYSLGLQWVFVRFLGTVPGPIVFGAVMDIACKQHRISCDDVKVCSIYDRYELSRNLFLVSFVFKMFTTLCYMIALVLYKPPQTGDDSNGSRRKAPQDSNINVSLNDTHENTARGVVNNAFTGESQSQHTPSEQLDITYL